MSRHKIVKNMDLEDELDDFDGGEDYDDDGGDTGLLSLYGNSMKINTYEYGYTELTEDDKGTCLLPRRSSNMRKPPRLTYLCRAITNRHDSCTSRTTK
jgi:hypothetical protein